MPEDMSDRMPEDVPDRMPEDLPDRMPEDMPEDMPDHMPEDMPDRMPNRMSEDMSDRMPEDLPVRKCINVMVGITRSKVIFHSFLYVYQRVSSPQRQRCHGRSSPIAQNFRQFSARLHGSLDHVDGLSASGHQILQIWEIWEIWGQTNLVGGFNHLKKY